MDPDKRSAWLQKLDAECPYQVVLPRRQLKDDSEIVNFLLGGCLSIIRPARDDDPLPSLVRRDLLITGVLSALAMTAALAWACALGQRWVVAEEALV
jgi:hypothetical protein